MFFFRLYFIPIINYYIYNPIINQFCIICCISKTDIANMVITYTNSFTFSKWRISFFVSICITYRRNFIFNVYLDLIFRQWKWYRIWKSLISTLSVPNLQIHLKDKFVLTTKHLMLFSITIKATIPSLALKFLFS